MTIDPALLWVTVTLLVFAAAERASTLCRRHPLAHPVFLGTPILMAILHFSATPYADYAAGTSFLRLLLGSATVAFAVPLWHQWPRIRSVALPLAAALAAGSVTAIGSAVAVGALLGAPPALLATLAPRAATAPVAMAIADQTGGIPALAALVALFSGMFGAMTAPILLRRMRISDRRARGFALGVAAHGLGTARAFQLSEEEGSFAAVGMATNAALTALLIGIAMAVTGA